MNNVISWDNENFALFTDNGFRCSKLFCSWWYIGLPCTIQATLKFIKKTSCVPKRKSLPYHVPPDRGLEEIHIMVRL